MVAHSKTKMSFPVLLNTKLLDKLLEEHDLDNLVSMMYI
jgi:hypothetical protein